MVVLGRGGRFLMSEVPLYFTLEGLWESPPTTRQVSWKCWYRFVRTRCRANMAHVRQSRPDSGLGFQVKVLKPFKVVPFSLGSGDHNGV